MIKLNIGGGGTKMIGHTSVDLYHNEADIKRDCADTGFASNMVSAIYSSHMIEHITYEHFIKALKHWNDILIKSGILTIRCPNAMLYIQEWIHNIEKEDWAMLSSWGTRNVLGWQNKGDGMLNRQLFTPEYLRWIVEKHGFSVDVCELTETRVINKSHIEYREKGDIILIGYKI